MDSKLLRDAIPSPNMDSKLGHDPIPNPNMDSKLNIPTKSQPQYYIDNFYYELSAFRRRYYS